MRRKGRSCWVQMERGKGWEENGIPCLLEAFVLLATVSIVGGGGPGKDVQITRLSVARCILGWEGG